MKIKVLYEDKDILAIEKPSGILVHPDGRDKDPSTSLRVKKTIFDLFIKKYPKLEIVHRLDKETSGVLLLAKNKKAYEFLKSQFKNREVKKTYVAIVNGSVKNDHGTINKPIGRSPADFRRRLAGRGARGEMREAITEYKVLKRFQITTPKSLLNKEGRNSSPPAKGECLKGEGVCNFSYLEIKPKTGRTHQIRVHLKFLNYPVVGDTLYNPNSPLPNLPLVKGEGKTRMFLHAKSIEFKNLKGEIVKVESAVPKEFLKMVK
jgi:23S rRNA pseudouridine1911/1915/1917 synthase